MLNGRERYPCDALAIHASAVMHLSVAEGRRQGSRKAVSESTPLRSAHVFRTAQTRTGESARIVRLIGVGELDAFAERSFRR